MTKTRFPAPHARSLNLIFKIITRDATGVELPLPFAGHGCRISASTVRTRVLSCL
jgi:hypothetical protein